MEKKTLAQKAEDLKNLVKSEQEQPKQEDARSLLQKAMDLLKGEKTVQKSEDAPVEEKPVEEKPVEEAPVEDAPAEESLTDEDIEELNSVEDVEKGLVSADEFLAKSTEFMGKLGKAILKLEKNIQELDKKVSDSAKGNEVVEKSLEAIVSAQMELVKAQKVEEKKPSAPKVLGKESLFKSETQEEEVEPRKELNQKEKDELYKAYFIEKSISYDTYQESKRVGELPKELKK